MTTQAVALEKDHERRWKFDRRISLDSLVIGIPLLITLIIWGSNLEWRTTALEKQQVIEEQWEDSFRTSLAAEKDARESVEAVDENNFTELNTIVHDRLNLKQ